jgi:hypothetical protein
MKGKEYVAVPTEGDNHEAELEYDDRDDEVVDQKEVRASKHDRENGVVVLT